MKTVGEADPAIASGIGSRPGVRMASSSMLAYHMEHCARDAVTLSSNYIPFPRGGKSLEANGAARGAGPYEPVSQRWTSGDPSQA
jgi:hypothetical protein